MNRCRLAIAATIFFLAIAATYPVQAEDFSAILDEVQLQVGQLELGGWDEMIDPIAAKLCQTKGATAQDMILSFAVDGFTADPMNILETVVNILSTNLGSQIGTLVMLMAVALLTGIVRCMAAGDANRQLTSLICYCLAVGLILTTLLNCLKSGTEAIARLSTFIGMAFPVLLSLLSAAGAPNSSGVMQPVTAVLCTSVTQVLNNLVLPLILVAGVLAAINNLTGRIQLKQLGKLAKSVLKWIMGLTVTVYLGVCSLSGISARTLDGLSIRTAKYALDKFVPIVGGMVSGTVDTLLGCAVLVKNAAGIAAIVITCGLMLQPLIHIAGTMLVFRLTSALCEPIADERMPQMLSDAADVLTYLFAAITMLCVLFLITTGMIMGMNGAFAGVG